MKAVILMLDEDKKPAHRPRRDPNAARVPLGLRVHPDSKKRLIELANKCACSQSEMFDKIVMGFPSQ